MRVMMKDLSSRGGSRGQSYGNTGSYRLADRTGAERSMGTKTDVKARASTYGKDTIHVKSDDGSDKSILGDTKNSGRITQTNEVTIAYSESGDDASSEGRVGKLS